MKNQPLVSVIVPVYNAEKYIDRCIQSLLSQTLSDIEIIMVDDGSADRSGAICEQYARKDQRINVFHQTNRGVAAARQRGIDMAQGIFSIHVDPDDWIESTMLEELYTKAIKSNSDVVICNFVAVYPKKNVVVTQELDENMSPSESLNNLLQNKMHGSLCTKLIRTQLYHKFNIRFVQELNYCEDYLVCVKLFTHDIKITYLNSALYYYDQIVNNDSITRIYTIKTLHQRLRFIEELQRVISNIDCIGPSNAITEVAYECYKHKILSSRDFANTFSRYKDHFKQSNYKFNRKLALRMAASGYQIFARIIS